MKIYIIKKGRRGIILKNYNMNRNVDNEKYYFIHCTLSHLIYLTLFTYIISCILPFCCIYFKI